MGDISTLTLGPVLRWISSYGDSALIRAGRRWRLAARGVHAAIPENCSVQPFAKPGTGTTSSVHHGASNAALDDNTSKPLTLATATRLDHDRR